MVPRTNGRLALRDPTIRAGNPRDRAPVDSMPRLRILSLASVAQWKSSSVLRKRLGVRVPPGAPKFCSLQSPALFAWSASSDWTKSVSRSSVSVVSFSLSQGVCRFASAWAIWMAAVRSAPSRWDDQPRSAARSSHTGKSSSSPITATPTRPIDPQSNTRQW